MTRDSTLDEFLGDDGGSDAGEADESADAVEAADPDLDPAPVTCEWTPGGDACEACGASVERRWVDGGARVCADCKEW